MLDWSSQVGLRKVSFVHYSGWEDGIVLSHTERENMLKNLNLGFEATFGLYGQEYLLKGGE